MGKRVAVLLAVILIASSAFAVTTKDMAAGLTAEEIAKILTGAGVTITNAKVTGGTNAIGSFDGGKADGLAIDSGVILSSGDVKTAAGPNTSEGTSGGSGGSGDASLDALVKPYKTKDAVILEFDAVTSSSTFSIRYVFASEEYKEYVGSQFNDVFAFFVDGQNIALIPGTAEPVAINTVNHQKNSGLFNDNPANSGKFGTSFDGFTTELIAVASVSAGTTHHIRLAVADTSDSILDSAVFIAKGGISGTGVAAAVVPELQELLVAGTVGTNQQDMIVTVYGVPDDIQEELSASGLPEDSKVTFKKIEPLGPHTPRYLMHIDIGPDTPPDVYPLTIRAGIGTTEVFGVVRVIVDCSPPLILGLPGHQPANVRVTRGTPATLKVTASGTAAFRYQWYNGYTGSTRFPVAGATSSELRTGPINNTSQYWVRVSSPCGTVDSQTATVTPQ